MAKRTIYSESRRDLPMHTTTRRAEALSPATEPRRRFDWLREKKRRRSALARIHHAVLHGWALDDEGRSDLIQVLGTLLRSGDLTTREGLRVCQIVVAMDKADVEGQAADFYHARCAAGRRPRGRPRVWKGANPEGDWSGLESSVTARTARAPLPPITEYSGGGVRGLDGTG